MKKIFLLLLLLLLGCEDRPCLGAPPAHMGPRAFHDYHLRCSDAPGPDCSMCNWKP